MGLIGFKFEIDELYENNLSLNGEKFDFDSFVVLINSPNLLGIRIISFDNKFSYGDTTFFYLNKENSLEKHVVFDTSKFIKSKICVNDLDVIDLDEGLCWVEVQKYHNLRQLLFIRNGDLVDEVMKRVPFLCDLFDKYFR